MKSVITLILTILLCTCGLAQNNLNKLPRDESSVAFIKGETGFLIDSITIRTSLDTLPYGFAFPDDTLILDISIFRPADELTLETFAGDHSFGRNHCWVDAPSADVYLSVQSGRNVIDSVGLSPLDRLLREEVAKIQAQTNPKTIKLLLLSSMDLFWGTPIAADFQAAYLEMFNLSRADLRIMGLNLQERPGPANRHPRFKEPGRKFRLMSSRLPGKLSKYDLNDKDGQPVEVERPKNQFYVINFYDSGTSASRRDHKIIAQSMATDSLFTGIPIISVSKENPAKTWQRYVREGNFSWPHYHENQASKRKLTKKMQLYPTNTYILLNKQNLIEGVYDDVVKLASALVWRKKTGAL